MTGRLIRRTDTSDNSIDLTYDGSGRLTLIQDAGSQQELRLSYGLFNGLTRLQRLETRALIEDASGRATATLGSALRQVEYDYDSFGPADHRHDGSDPGRRQHCRRCRLRHELYLRRYDHAHRQRDAERRHERVLHL